LSNLRHSVVHNLAMLLRLRPMWADVVLENPVDDAAVGSGGDCSFAVETWTHRLQSISSHSYFDLKLPDCWLDTID